MRWYHHVAITLIPSYLYMYRIKDLHMIPNQLSATWCPYTSVSTMVLYLLGEGELQGCLSVNQSPSMYRTTCKKKKEIKHETKTRPDASFTLFIFRFFTRYENTIPNANCMSICTIAWTIWRAGFAGAQFLWRYRLNKFGYFANESVNAQRRKGFIPQPKMFALRLLIAERRDQVGWKRVDGTSNEILHY